jgi:hypothetical protein
MAVIWGLDLKEMQWGKFKNSYMWNKEYHLRRTKFVVYQLAMIFCVVSESLGTAALSGMFSHCCLHLHPMSYTSANANSGKDYVDQQEYIEKYHPGATVHNNDYVGIASYNIFVGVYVATIFGSAFFFDLFWPERVESPAVKLAWRICSVLACVFTLACALAYTVILAMHSAYVTGANAEQAQRYLAEYGGSPMKYRENGRAVASLVFEWLGWPATIARYATMTLLDMAEFDDCLLIPYSTIILWRSLAHNDKLGPKSTHARVRDGVGEKHNEAVTDAGSVVSNDGMGPRVPPVTHTGPPVAQESV